jgi:hypothetical protein
MLQERSDIHRSPGYLPDTTAFPTRLGETGRGSGEGCSFFGFGAAGSVRSVERETGREIGVSGMLSGRVVLIATAVTSWPEPTLPPPLAGC